LATVRLAAQARPDTNDINADPGAASAHVKALDAFKRSAEPTCVIDPAIYEDDKVKRSFQPKLPKDTEELVRDTVKDATVAANYAICCINKVQIILFFGTILYR
jgi:hypothetical protein